MTVPPQGPGLTPTLPESVSGSSAVVDGPGAQTLRRPPVPLTMTVAVVLLLTVGVVLVVLASRSAGTTSTAPVRGSWQIHLLAAGDPQQDAVGNRWSTSQAPRGGRDVEVPTSARGTGSPALYETVRSGVQGWAVAVPAPGYYAVDLLLADPDPQAATRPVFDVVAGQGKLRRTLAAEVELQADPSTPQHVAGWVQVEGTTLDLTFRAGRGLPAVAGVVVTSLGDQAPGSLLEQEFDGPVGAPVPAPWTPVTGAGPHGDGEVQGYSASTDHVFLDGEGHLVLKADAVPYVPPATEGPDAPTQPWTSGRVETAGDFSVTYGDVAVTAQVPAGQGFWPAFWMLGEDIDQVDWPRSGEVDVMEILGGTPETTHASVRALGDARDDVGWLGQRVSRLGSAVDTGASLATGPHEYRATLLPTSATFSLDGQAWFTLSSIDRRPGQQWPLGKPYYLLLNLAVGGTWGGPPDESTPSTGALVVDDVSVWGWS